jgi:prevent-host-death family protein
MVCYDSSMRTVTIADLKNNLSRYLREVRGGQEFTVLSRDVPVARVVGVGTGLQSLESRLPAPEAPRLKDVSLPPPLDLTADVLDVLLRERGDR